MLAENGLGGFVATGLVEDTDNCLSTVRCFCFMGLLLVVKKRYGTNWSKSGKLR